jgi:hypothetical protein
VRTVRPDPGRVGGVGDHRNVTPGT